MDKTVARGATQATADDDRHEVDRDDDDAAQRHSRRIFERLAVMFIDAV